MMALAIPAKPEWRFPRITMKSEISIEFFPPQTPEGVEKLRVVREKLSNARRAALTALSTSAAEPRLMRETTSSLEGLMTSRLRGLAGATHWPSM